MKHREVLHYGYEFRYDINDVDADDPLLQSIPVECNEILQKALQTGYVKHLPDQLTVNKYVQGQGIPPHVDTPPAFEDGIMSLSLLSQIVMEFSHPGGQQISVLLPRRSLLIMTGESRYLWSHCITPRKSDIITTADGLDLVMRETRVSFTFRKIIHPKDRIGRIVPFQTSDLSIMLPKCDTDAEKLENSHVQQVYEEIADHFSGTRHTPWPKISQFIKDMPVGSLMADIGCGNGKYLGLNQSVYEVGSDRSVNLSEICHGRSHEVGSDRSVNLSEICHGRSHEVGSDRSVNLSEICHGRSHEVGSDRSVNLSEICHGRSHEVGSDRSVNLSEICHGRSHEVGSDRSVNLSEICHGRSHEVYVGDVLHIPLRSSSFDYCICIAVIHHMST
ncbi:hypothetical protein AM593_06724, partial [Mytilus galloprovincialis]